MLLRLSNNIANVTLENIFTNCLQTVQNAVCGFQLGPRPKFQPMQVPIWFFYVCDDPKKHRFISQSEVTMLEKNCNRKEEETLEGAGTSIPWLNIFLSVPIWGNFCAFFSQDFLLYIFLTSLPKYLNNVHNFDVSHRKSFYYFSLSCKITLICRF